jgi:hypothetical protein
MTERKFVESCSDSRDYPDPHRRSTTQRPGRNHAHILGSAAYKVSQFGGKPARLGCIFG